MRAIFPNEMCAQRPDNAGKRRTGQQPEDNEFGSQAAAHLIYQYIHADVNTGTDAIGRAEFCHPHEHDDGQFLGPAEVQA